MSITESFACSVVEMGVETPLPSERLRAEATEAGNTGPVNFTLITGDRPISYKVLLGNVTLLIQIPETAMDWVGTGSGFDESLLQDNKPRKSKHIKE